MNSGVSFGALAAVTMLACSGNDPGSRAPMDPGASDPVLESADALSSRKGQKDSPAEPAPAVETLESGDSPDEDSEGAGGETSTATEAEPAAGNVEIQTTSDGETIVVVVPEPAPTEEVPAGGTCGVITEDGVLLSCQPGTYCLSPADGVPGTCQAAPRAPNTDG